MSDSLAHTLQAMLRRHRRKCSHIHTNCQAALPAMVEAFELGMATADRVPMLRDERECN